MPPKRKRGRKAFAIEVATEVATEELKLNKEAEEVAEMLRKAEAGHGEAMCNLGGIYRLGQKGLAIDEAKAFEWYEKSHEAGFAGGTGGLGRCYLVGKGVPKCPVRGSTLLGEAAGRGSKAACYTLGLSYAEGIWGFPTDEKMARRYYSMMASATINDCNVKTLPVQQRVADKWLREHRALSDPGSPFASPTGSDDALEALCMEFYAKKMAHDEAAKELHQEDARVKQLKTEKDIVLAKVKALLVQYRESLAVVEGTDLEHRE